MFVNSKQALHYSTDPHHPEQPKRIEWILEGLNVPSSMIHMIGESSLPEVRIDSVDIALRAVHGHRMTWANPLKGMRMKQLDPTEDYIAEDTATCIQYSLATIAIACNHTRINRVSSFVATRPPGHHADGSRPKGFCYLNNCLVAAAYLGLTSTFKHILIYDIDHHYGGGIEKCLKKKKFRSFLRTHNLKISYISSHATGKQVFDAPHREWGHLSDSEAEKYDIYRLINKKGSLDDHLDFVTNYVQNPVSPVDVILIAAGFDNCTGETINPETRVQDSTWGTQDIDRLSTRLQECAQHTTAGGLISILEGGYTKNILSKMPPLFIRNTVFSGQSNMKVQSLANRSIRRIVQFLGDEMYRVELMKPRRNESVITIHLSDLATPDNNFPHMVQDFLTANNMFIIQDLLVKRVQADGTTEYLVSWEGFNQKHNSWEPADQLPTLAIQLFKTRAKRKHSKKKHAA